MAAFTIYYNGDTSVTFRVTGATVGGLVRILFRPTSTSTLLYDIAFKVTSTTFTKTFPDGVKYNVYEVYTANDYYTGGLSLIDLNPDTEYVGEVRIKASTSTTSWTSLGKVTWTTAAVAEWDWFSSNGTATATQTYTAYRGMTELENCWWLGHFHYKVWNDMVNKTYAIAIDRKGYWNTTHGTLADTLLTASDTEITSAKLNSVRWNLSQFVSTGLPEMAAGDDLPGSYFITLAEAINNAIWRGSITYG